MHKEKIDVEEYIDSLVRTEMSKQNLPEKEIRQQFNSEIEKIRKKEYRKRGITKVKKEIEIEKP